MAGHRRAEATPSFGRLCPAMTNRAGSNLPDGQISALCATHLSSPLCKNILLRGQVETALLIRPSRSSEGRFAIVTNAERDAMDAAAPKDERRYRGR